MYVKNGKESVERMEVGSFQWCSRTGQEVMGRNCHTRFCTKVRKHFFAVQVMEHRHKLPREVVQSPFSETLKSCLDVVLGNLF